jgi:hypothetical protein
MMNEEINYEAWLNGDIILKYTDVFYNPKNGKIPIIVDYTDFSDEDEAKVRKCQKLLFKQGVSNLLAKWQIALDSQYQNSQNKELLIANRIALIEKVLFGQKIHDVDFTNFEPHNLVFYTNDLLGIRDYATRVIIDGQDYQYENVQSANSPYYDSNKVQCEQYAQALWEQLQLLKNIPKRRPAPLDTIWFKIGLLIANGEMDKLIEKHERNFRAIAREIGIPGSRPYISDSINGNKAKNIFASKFKVLFITDYCEKNEIPIVDTFTTKQKKS